MAQRQQSQRQQSQRKQSQRQQMELEAREKKRQNLLDKEELQKAKELAKKKKIVLKDEPFRPGKINCKDCSKPLPEPNWFAEEILFLGVPMVKYWLVWSGMLQPVAYSQPTHEKEFICRSCFGERENSLAKRRLRPSESLPEAAARLTIEILKNPQNEN